jgi:hypothetical protein
MQNDHRNKGALLLGHADGERVMRDLQVYAWRLADFVGPVSLPLFRRGGRNENPKAQALALKGRATPVALYISDVAGPSQGARGGVMLARELRLNGQRHAAGTPLAAVQVLSLAGPGAPEMVIVALDGQPAVVVASQAIRPGHEMRIHSWRPAGDTPPAEGLGHGTQLETPYGPMPVDQLAEGDEVLVQGCLVSRVRRLEKQAFCAAELAFCPWLRPVRISAGALGGRQPAADLSLAAGQKVLAGRPHEGGSDAIPAGLLIDGQTVAPVLPLFGASYFRLRLDSALPVMANGLPVAIAAPEGPEAATVLPGYPPRPAMARHGGRGLAGTAAG